MAVKKGAKKKKAAKPARPTKKKTAKKTVKRSAAKASTVKKKTARKTARKVTPKKAKKTIKPESSKLESSAMTVLPKRRISLAERKRNEVLKKMLLKKRNEVVEGLESQMGRKLARETGQKIDSAMDSADQSALDVDQGIDYSLLEMKYAQYKDIADAFRKLQSNTYGECEECGEEIDIKRLAVNPLARYCVACKTNKETLENIQKEETRFKE
ncbi:MAG: TraR/DksA C4-type zinc finger protein [Nitrospirae bacterium]|nr:TraR/DksA C4-type zinc finger protein [Nitrospirota bacterium]